MHRRVLRASLPLRRRAIPEKVPSDVRLSQCKTADPLGQPPAALMLPIIFWCIELIDWIAM
jgi:hypothetical protein